MTIRKRVTLPTSTEIDRSTVVTLGGFEYEAIRYSVNNVAAQPYSLDRRAIPLREVDIILRLREKR